MPRQRAPSFLSSEAAKIEEGPLLRRGCALGEAVLGLAQHTERQEAHGRGLCPLPFPALWVRGG